MHGIILIEGVRTDHNRIEQIYRVTSGLYKMELKHWITLMETLRTCYCSTYSVLRTFELPIEALAEHKDLTHCDKASWAIPSNIDFCKKDHVCIYPRKNDKQKNISSTGE